MTPFMLYCWQMLDGVISLLTGTAFISGIILFVVCLLAYLEDELKAKFKSLIIFLTPIFIISSIFLVLTPTTKQAAIIFGVPMMLNQAKEIQADKVPAKLIEYLNLYLDEEIVKKKN